jgi:hypothetical protein
LSHELIQAVTSRHSLENGLPVYGRRGSDDELPAVFLVRRRVGQSFPAREKGEAPSLNDLIQPGKTAMSINATELMWDLFEKHPKPWPAGLPTGIQVVYAVFESLQVSSFRTSSAKR